MNLLKQFVPNKHGLDGIAKFRKGKLKYIYLVMIM